MEANAPKLKCLVWDLDNTLWEGTISEGDEVVLRDGVTDIIKTLDERGILQSICSKNNLEPCREKLESFGLWDYFIYPEINWNPKSENIQQIKENINIGMDTIAFIDDQPFERDEVKFTHPEVMTIDGENLEEVLEIDRLMPKFITSDSKHRRAMYQADIERNNKESVFSGTKEEFLKTLGMKFTLARAVEEDLQRAEELTVRTNQLNSTGYVYSYDELNELKDSPDHIVLIGQLVDNYGTYGKIGLALVEKKETYWELQLLLMSCRVMSKGVGNIFLIEIMNRAREEGVDLRARFVPTDRNKIMYVTYKFNGFEEIGETEEYKVLQADLSKERQIPDYVELDSNW